MPASPASTWDVIRRLWPEVWRYRWRVGVALVCLVAAKLANVGVPLVMKELIDELDLVANARDVGGYFRKALTDVFDNNPIVGEVRGEGLLAAVEFVRDREDRVFFDAKEKVGPRIVAALLQRGVIARAMPQGDIMGFAPPLCLTREEADTIVAAAKGAVEEIAATL